MLKWEEKAKEAYLKYENEPTYVKAYRKGDLYVVHGEITILCFNKNFEKLWEFCARDIWITTDDSEAIVLHNKYIQLKDWRGYVYKLDYQGRLISEDSSGARIDE